MKKTLLSLIWLSISGMLFAQTNLGKNAEQARKDYDNFIGKVLQLNTNSPQTSFIFDISKSPTLKLNLPIHQGIASQLFVTGNISSTNNYTPLIKKGKWSPDASINANWSHFIWKIIKFRVSDLMAIKAGMTDAEKQQAVNNASINNASQINFLWFTLGGGYNHSGYTFFSDAAGLNTADRISNQSLNSGILSGNLNWYLYPSKRLVPWLSISASAGYTFKTNDNNYNSLTPVTVKTFNTYTDPSGTVMQEDQDETTARKGNFIVSNSSTFDYNLLALASITEKFYVGLTFYGKTRTTQGLTSTDLGIGISIPIQKKKDDNKTLANFTLKYDLPDVRNQLNNKPMSEKGKLGFTIGVPLPSFRTN